MTTPIHPAEDPMGVAGLVLPDAPRLTKFVFTEWDTSKQRDTDRTEEYFARTLEDAVEMLAIIHDAKVREEFGYPIPGMTRISRSGRSVTSAGKFYYVME